MENQITFNDYDLLLVCCAISIEVFIWFFLFKKRNNTYELDLKEQISRLKIKHQKELAEVSFRAQEAEKFRIGQNLHDDLGHTLASLKLTLDMPVYENLDKAAFDKFKSNCNVLLEKIISNVRSTSHNLSPVNIQLYGLSGAVEELVTTINQTGGLEVTFRNEAQEAFEIMDQNTALALLRVFEELLTNTMKHASAKNVLIYFFTRGRALSILYADDGKGMESSVGKGIGLHNINNRLSFINSDLQITSSPGAGFTIEITLHPS